MDPSGIVKGDPFEFATAARGCEADMVRLTEGKSIIATHYRGSLSRYHMLSVWHDWAINVA